MTADKYLLELGVPPPLTDVEWPAGTAWPPQPGGPPAAQANLADFGPMIASVDVDDAVIATLKRWLATYLRAIGRKKNLEFDLALPNPSSYANALSRDEFKDYPLPAVLVVTARTATQPINTPLGYTVEWQVAVSAIVRGRTPVETRQYASYYELAIRLALTQQGDLDGFANETRWVTGAEARPLADPRGQGRWLGEGASTFTVFTDGAVDGSVGPTQPDQEPYADLAQVVSVDIDIEGAGINPTEGDDDE